MALFKRDKYAVMVDDGVDIETYPVHEITGFNQGYALRYKNHDGVEDLVYVPRTYQWKRIDGVYCVGKNLGNNSAAALIEGSLAGSDGKEKIQSADTIVGAGVDANCPGEDLSALGRSDLYSRGLKALYGETHIPWKPIIICIAIGVVIFIGVMISKRQAAGCEIAVVNETLRIALGG